jgi:hypothetical protein
VEQSSIPILSPVKAILMANRTMMFVFIEGISALSRSCCSLMLLYWLSIRCRRFLEIQDLGSSTQTPDLRPPMLNINFWRVLPLPFEMRNTNPCTRQLIDLQLSES